MIETGVVIDNQGNAIHWHLPAGRNTGALPDSRDLWDVLWENRETIAGFAHSHPGSGVTGPSSTDLTTFAAVEAGLGRRLVWWITSSDHLIALRWVGPGRLTYHVVNVDEEPEWVHELRRLSEVPQIESERK
jgi:proteasome lid subunit RPN8/RPN11